MEYKIREKAATLSAIPSKEGKLRMIYMWIKQSAITRDEFISLISLAT